MPLDLDGAFALLLRAQALMGAYSSYFEGVVTETLTSKRKGCRALDTRNLEARLRSYRDEALLIAANDDFSTLETALRNNIVKIGEELGIFIEEMADVVSADALFAALDGHEKAARTASVRLDPAAADHLHARLSLRLHRKVGRRVAPAGNAAKETVEVAGDSVN